MQPFDITVIIYLRGDLMLVNRIRIGSAVDKELYIKLQELSKASQIPISKLLDNAIKLLLINHKEG